jgi:hypothetical protein
MQIVFSEKELEDFLCQDNNLKKYLNLEFIDRQVNIFPAGIIDIFAYDRDSNCFVIIELKKDLLDNNALIQGMSYLKYYQDVRKFNFVHRKKTRNFALLLIGQNLSQDLSKIVNHNEIDCIFKDNHIYYNLFGLDLKKGIDFTFYSKGQSNYDYQIQEQVDLWEQKAHDIIYNKSLRAIL